MEDDLAKRTLTIVLLAILALIVFWLVMRFWHKWHTAPSDVPQHASRSEDVR